METAKQFSVPLVNKPGRLAVVLSALSKEKVGIRAFCVMDSGQRGMLRFVPDDSARASSTLETINVVCETADVLLVEISNQSGGLPKICQRLAAEHLNVDYAYGSLNLPLRAKGGSLAVIKVNDLVKAQRVLGEPARANGPRPKLRPGRRPTHAR